MNESREMTREELIQAAIDALAALTDKERCEVFDGRFCKFCGRDVNDDTTVSHWC